MAYKQNSPFKMFVRKFLKQRLAVFALAVVVAIMLVGVIGPFFAPYDPHRPVTAQYADKGIDIDQLTNSELVLEGVFSNGETQPVRELGRLEVETDNRRIAQIRQTQSGITIVANTSGYTFATVTADDVSISTEVLVEGEADLDDRPPILSQIRLNQPEEAVSVGDSYQLDAVGIFTDDSELSSIDELRSYAEQTFEMEEEESSSGFNTGASSSSDSLPFVIEAVTEDTISVAENGEITFEEDGEGVVMVRAGTVSSLIQFQIGADPVEPILTHFAVEDTTTVLSDAYKHQQPSSIHWFGTDHQNRDILSRIIHGTSDTLLIGFVSVAIGTMIGTVIGLLAGYYGGWIDSLATRMTDILLAFPGILLAIAVIAFLGPGLTNIIFAVAVFTIPVFIRIVRASTLSLKEMTYVEAAKSIGVRDSVIIMRHIFPGTLSVVLVYLTMRIGVAILIGAALSFLGLGGDITAPEWGSMLSAAKDNSGTIFHATFFPGLAIVITVLSFNIFGDGLRDALDPKLKE
ncbi:ABC transporter permease subunit [Paenalkalicoccus suaedae]|uniref:Glutathione transport system permease protein GsiD n=1 Tax=Paenalkalicoccus suaedae TaxID=2592382 RepID=A0A859FC09_9BACI|nr:ABC transporter permease subunit [Paenalkalicoccus suaedae]QKS69766.1 ABC transporter permease subunit [Paenalkalicoccus suaedae]